MESRHFRTGQKNILLSCPQCLDSMLAPGFMNSVYSKMLRRDTKFVPNYCCGTLAFLVLKALVRQQGGILSLFQIIAVER